MTGPARTAFGVVAGGAYVLGLGLAALSALLAVLIGPVDTFAIQMIVIPAIVAVLGIVSFALLVGPNHRKLLALLVAIGAAWAVVTVLFMLLMAPLFTP